VQGCVFVPNNLACDDDDPCTQPDLCAGGWCFGTPVVCNDNNVCTDDFCDAGGDCQSTPNQLACPGGHCDGGSCVPDCVPDCDGKLCGADGCGGSCGDCPGAQDACYQGSCICMAECQGKECGADGCDGQCGICNDHPNSVCLEDQCDCLPDDCVDLGHECDSWADGCGGTADCGGCECGHSCDGGECIFHACDGKECGADGCGDTCGECGAEEQCVAGQCQSTAGRRVFVTSTKYTANLGGVTGGDAKCQNRANAAGLGGSWKAWLSQPSGGNNSVAQRFTHYDGPYKLLDGTVIADSWADLTDGTLDHVIDRTEFNNPSGGGYVWTATLANGAFNTGSWGGCGNTVCNNWTVGNTCLPCGSCGGFSGNPEKTNKDWTEGVCGCCDNNFALFCFEQ